MVENLENINRFKGENKDYPMQKWTGRSGVLQFMESQWVGHDWATELNVKMLSFPIFFPVELKILYILSLSLRTAQEKTDPHYGSNPSILGRIMFQVQFLNL